MIFVKLLLWCAVTVPQQFQQKISNAMQFTYSTTLILREAEILPPRKCIRTVLQTDIVVGSLSKAGEWLRAGN